VDGQSGSPELAIGTGTIALAWTVTIGRRHEIWAAIFDREYNGIGAPFPITNDTVSGVFPGIIWNADRYVVTFYDPDSPLHAIWGYAFDEAGTVRVPLKQLTESPRFTRYPSLLPLGDRAFLVFADTKDGNAGYELYSKMLDRDLNPLSAERRITNAPGDSIFPIAAFGPTGDVGVLFRDDRGGALHAWFTRLVCEAK
jgi:hypothetical protein